MKKHIIGLAVFSFIVGASTIIFSVLSPSEIIPVPVPQNNSTNLPTSCWAMKRELKEFNSNSSIIKQAVFNLNTKQFSWSRL